MLEKIREEVLDAEIPFFGKANVFVSNSPLFKDAYGEECVIVSGTNATIASGNADVVNSMARVTVWIRILQDHVEETLTAEKRLDNVVEHVRDRLQCKLLTGMSSPLVYQRKDKINAKNAIGVSMIYTYTEVLT